MAAYLCRCCGAVLDVKKGMKVCGCGYCGITQTVPRLDFDEKAVLWERADALRRNGEFDRAAALYGQLAELDPTDPDIFWCITLCRFGVEYVEEPVSHKRVPTINRVQYSPFIEDKDYRKAVDIADGDQRRIYIIQARQLEELRRSVLEVSRTERPYDIFICYKETDSSGRRTEDSLLAAQLYRSFTAEGLRVFYARVTLEDKAGLAYEPYIFAAINSAKIMLALGTSPDNFNAVWVKNEWSRYLTRIAETSQGVLAILYKDMLPAHLPKEFAHLQTFDMSAPDFMNDLLRGVRKVLSAEDAADMEKEQSDAPAPGNSETADPAALLRRAELALEDGEFDDADGFCERVLDIEPETAAAYLIKLLAQYHVGSVEQLNEVRADISYSGNYKKCLRFADEELRDRLTECRNSMMYGIWHGGYESARTAEECFAAAEGFKALEGYADSAEMAERCFETAEKLQNEEAVLRMNREYCEARMALDRDGDLESLAESQSRLEALGDYKDSAELAARCAERISELTEEKRRLEAEEEKAECEERLRRERSRKAIIRAAAIGISSAAAVIAAVFIIRGAALSSAYKNALALRDAGEYEKAAAAFSDIYDYSDSAEQLKQTRYLEAMSIFEAGDYIEAEKCFKALGVYSDATSMASESRYRRALTLAESDTELAISLMESLGAYSDSAEKALVIQYEKAVRLCGEKRYDEAAELFWQLGGYSDAAERAISTMYSCGEYNIEIGQYDKAAAAFESLGDYSDSAERAAEAKYLCAEQYYDNGSCSEAAELYCELLGCYRSEERQNELKFKAGRAYIGAGDYNQAMELLSKSTYEGAAELYSQASYDYALEYAEGGEYDKALSLLAAIPDYRDSAEKELEYTYRKALGLLDEGYYESAENILNELGDYGNSKELLAGIPDMRFFNAKVGDVISFGNCKQHILGYEEDIRWLVLERKDDSVLVVSEKLLDYLPYGGEEWADSSLRTWLNGEFYDKSFSVEQKARILSAEVTALGDESSADTEDKVFLLSAADTYNYFSDIEARKAGYSGWAERKYSDSVQTTYATSESRAWWLRDTSYRQYNIKNIGSDGVLGGIKYDESSGVRPAMWIDLSRVG